MKTIKIFVFLLSFSGMIKGQNSPIDKLFDKYAYQDGFTTVYISKYMFSLFANKDMKENESDEFAKAINGLESIRILVMDSTDKKINFFTEIGKDLPMNLYSPLMIVKEKDQELRMLIREKEGKIVEFLMIGGGEENLLICITGKLT
ncbi:MAG: DUF4252 domain-containing protein [Bacteroidales bacterium]|nr:DUF4252 domain-containing protein [Bacteroidales bacterium]